MAALALFLRSAARPIFPPRHALLPLVLAVTRSAGRVASEPSFASSLLFRGYVVPAGSVRGVGLGRVGPSVSLEQALHSRGTASASLAWAGKGAAGARSGEALQRQIRAPASVVLASLRCYWELSKARLSMLVVTTAGLGFVMGSGEVVDWTGLAWTSAGTMMAACSANAFNQIMEIANDSRMRRTMRRPLPSGRISLPHAVAFAVIMGVGGVAGLYHQTNSLTAELGAANLLLYTLVYTPLKQVHWINTWVGAVVGAIPPLMGWAAAAGQIDAGGWIMGALLYFWQIPHFMALAYLCRQDYAAGRYKMLSLGDLSGRRVALAALRNCMYLVPVGFLAQDYNVVSGQLGTQMMVLSAGFGASATSFYISPTSLTARRMFRVSLLYLPAIMAAMIYQRIPNPNLRSHEAEDAENEGATEYRKQLVYTDLKGLQTDLTRPWSGSPPIASLSAAPFPFLPAPEDRTVQHS